MVHQLGEGQGLSMSSCSPASSPSCVHAQRTPPCHRPHRRPCITIQPRACPFSCVSTILQKIDRFIKTASPAPIVIRTPSRRPDVPGTPAPLIGVPPAAPPATGQRSAGSASGQRRAEDSVALCEGQEGPKQPTKKAVDVWHHLVVCKRPPPLSAAQAHH